MLPALRHVELIEVFIAVFGDVVLAALKIVAQQQVEDLLRPLDVLGHDLDETARFGIHRRHPHHLRVVLTKTL